MDHDEEVPSLPSAAIAVEVPDVDDELGALIDLAEDVSPEDVGRVEAVDQIESGRWRIDDPVTADWALRKLREAEIRIDEIDRQHAQFVAGIDRWRDEQTKTYRGAVSFFTQHLEDYGRRWRASIPPSRPKTLALPSGAVKTHTSKAAVVIDDKDVILKWAKENEPTLVHAETREWVLVSEVRDYVEIKVDVDEEAPELITKTLVVHRVTGEIVPGLGVRAEHVDVDVTTEPP
jgi:hypothetical protein